MPACVRKRRITGGQGLEHTRLGDPQRIRQVLTNLVGNAIKFTDRGGIAVSATDDERYVRFEVRDTGPGVGPARRDAIFEEFAQADPARPASSAARGSALPSRSAWLRPWAAPLNRPGIRGHS